MTEMNVAQSMPVSRAHNHDSSADPYANSARRQWWLVFCLLFLMMLGTIDRQIVSLLVNPIKEDLGLTDTQISIVYGAAFALANLAFTLPAGYFADRLNRRLLVGLGATVWSVMTLFCGMASNYWQLLWTRAGGGFGEGVIGPCSMSMLRSALSPERRGRGFSVFSMASMTGSALALVVGGILIGVITEAGITSLPIVGDVAPWQIVLILIGAVGTPLGLLMLTVYEPIREQPAADASGATFREALSYIGARWKLYLPLFAYQALYGLSALSFGAWIAAMIGRSYGLSIPQIGATLGLMMLI
ncbi:MAG: MFS transporter, partial [Rhodospirillaceae bacterium]|nr:MFS transporter [Rhodospirillaceae bacterium]